MNVGHGIAAFDLLTVDLPFRRPFKHAAAERSSSHSVFLKCVTDDGTVGFGECLPRSHVTGETCDGVFELLRVAILPQLIGRRFESLQAVEDFLGACDGRAPDTWVDRATPQSAAWCAVDLALLDAFGCAFGSRPLAHQTASPAAHLSYSGVLSAERGPSLAISTLTQRLFGFRQIKLKVAPTTTDQAVRWVRRLCGRRMDLRVDVNMGWTRENAPRRMRALSRHGIRMFEQPIAAGDVSGLARLTAETGLGVMADETFTTRESLAELIERHACTAVNARLSKCGGLLATLARCREALAARLDLQIGCQVGETSLLSAAQLVLLSAVAPVRYAEGCFGRHLLRQDPGSPVLQFGFRGRPPALPAGPGFGIEMDEQVLARYATRHESIRARTAIAPAPPTVRSQPGGRRFVGALFATARRGGDEAPRCR
jgi:muconate cycloisomerase